MKKTIDKEQFGPWALVTGASSGIGAEFARQLAANGFNLVLVARRLPLLEELGQQLSRHFGIDYVALEADLAAEDAVEKITDATRHLQVGLLISNAGTGRPGKFLSQEVDDLMYVVRLNALSHLTLTHYFARKMVERGKGGVLLTGAMGAIDGLPYMSNESGTKSMIQGWGKALHTELATSGVHLTVLITSPTETPVLPLLGFTKENLPMKPISAEECVAESLSALARNRRTVIPGRKFRLMNSLIPASVSRRMMADIFRKNNNIL